MTLPLDLARITLYKNNLAFCVREGRLGEGRATASEAPGLAPPKASNSVDLSFYLSFFSLLSGLSADFELRVPEARRKLVVNTLSASAPGGASIIFGKDSKVERVANDCL